MPGLGFLARWPAYARERLERAAEPPLRLPVAVPALIVQAVRRFLDDNASMMAAALAYYGLFSLFPLAILALALLGFFVQDADVRERLVEAALDAVPLSETEGQSTVRDVLQHLEGAAAGLGIFGLLSFAWSASNVFGALRRSLNIVFGVEKGRSFPLGKLVDLASMTVLTLLLGGSYAVTFLMALARQFSERLPVIGPLAESLGPAWVAVSVLVSALVTFAAFLFAYSVVPAARLRPADVWPGALVGSLLLVAVDHGFAFYLRNFANFGAVFGPIGAVVAFLFWLYVSALLFLFGAEVASSYIRLRGRQPAAASAGDA